MAVDPRQVNKSFTLMGSSFLPGAGAAIDKLRPNQGLSLKREPDNEHDKNAIKVWWGNRALGYVPRQLAAEIAPLMDAGVAVICRKAPPLPRFGAYRGILEMAYIPPEEVAPLPEGVTQKDLDTATDLPPLNDGRDVQQARRDFADADDE